MRIARMALVAAAVLLLAYCAKRAVVASVGEKETGRTTVEEQKGVLDFSDILKISDDHIEDIDGIIDIYQRQRMTLIALKDTLMAHSDASVGKSLWGTSL